MLKPETNSIGQESGLKKWIALPLATGFGLGLSPVASGTVGSLWGLVIVIFGSRLDLLWQIVGCVALVIVAIPICGAAEDILKKKDDGRIVADEFLTFPICMIGLPCLEHWWLLALGFITNRVLDIIKPPPARQAQNLYGGIGIVLDDVFSSLYALGINWGVWVLAQKVIG